MADIGEIKETTIVPQVIPMPRRFIMPERMPERERELVPVRRKVSPEPQKIGVSQ